MCYLVVAAHALKFTIIDSTWSLVWCDNVYWLTKISIRRSESSPYVRMLGRTRNKWIVCGYRWDVMVACEMGRSEAIVSAHISVYFIYLSEEIEVWRGNDAEREREWYSASNFGHIELHFSPVWKWFICWANAPNGPHIVYLPAESTSGCLIWSKPFTHTRTAFSLQNKSSFCRSLASQLRKGFFLYRRHG